MESLDQEFASKPNGTHPEPVRRFSPAELAAMMDPNEYPPVKFGKGASDCFAHEWACWIFTTMREDELAGRKPRPFSAWVGAAVMANRDGTL